MKYEYDEWFDTDENRILLAICTRKLISNIGVGGIIWGIINIGLGYVWMQHDMINICVAILGVMMLATGVQALHKPSLRVLLMETVITVMLFFWNLRIAILNYRATGAFVPQGLIFPFIIAVAFAGYYRKLGHLRDLIESVDPAKIKATKQMCKTLVKKKLKNEPTVVQASSRKCRAQMMEDSAFFIQRDLLKAFVAPKDAVRHAIVKPDARSLKMEFNHPLGKLKYGFDKKNSEKLKNWISMESAQTEGAA